MWDQLDIPFDGWEIHFRNTVSPLLKKKAQKLFFTQGTYELEEEAS